VSKVSTFDELPISQLKAFITEQKDREIEAVLAQRTRHICAVMEDLQDPHNTNAIIRSAESLGMQDIHIIENEYAYKLTKSAAKGSFKWVDYHMYSEAQFNTPACFSHLRERGYQIVVMELAPNTISPDQLDLRKPVAVVFGNETKGCSAYALEHADAVVSLPMYGFTESLNVSVTAAMVLNAWMTKLRQSDVCWALQEEEKELLRRKWYKKIMTRSPYPKDEFGKRKRL
jgi:tRNA (guanosine-2'-O-)-methyltransferase